MIDIDEKLIDEVINAEIPDIDDEDLIEEDLEGSYLEDIIDLDVDTLNELGMIQFANDPDVEVYYDGPSEDAGIDGHGANTEEEMMYTWSGYVEPSTDS